MNKFQIRCTITYRNTGTDFIKDSLMDGIGKTSLLVAALRARETQRPLSEGRLFEDPFAEKLAGSAGFQIMDEALRAAGDQPAIAIRTFFIDQKIQESIELGYQQIVILAAGMDSRAYRMDELKNTTVFEIDRIEVLKYKNEILQNEKPKSRRICVDADLKNPWTKLLSQSGFQPNLKTVWLVEGLLMYLEESDIKNIFQQINQLSKSQDWLICDILSETLLHAPHMKNQLDFLKSMGAPWKFGTNEPEQFLADFGWNAQTYQPGEIAPQRWPFPTAPRHIPNVPRGFWVHAIKNERD